MKKYKTVYDLLKSKDRWTRFASAKNKRNEICNIEDKNACKFCLEGAIGKVYGFGNCKAEKAGDKIAAAIKKIKGRCYDIIQFNDSHITEHSDILKVLKLAKV